MDEGILEVSELAGDRVVELRVVDELRVVGLITCEREGIVGGDEGPVGGLRRLLVTESKVVGVHGEEAQEKDEEVRGEVKGEVEQLREKRSSWMAWRWNDGLKDDLSQCGCDTCVMKTRHPTACRRAQTSRILCLCLSVYVVSQLSLSTLVLKVYLSSYTFA